MEAADLGAIEGLFARCRLPARPDGGRLGLNTGGLRLNTLLGGDAVAAGGSCTLQHRANADDCVKVVRGGHDCSAVCEVAILTALNHPNVMRVLGVEYGPDYMCIQMPYYSRSLRDYCRYDGESEPIGATRGKFAGDIASGLAYIHSRGVIHADLKPDNILVDCSALACVIADFGTSLLASSPMIGCDLQTQLYRAPENTVGSAPSVLMDMWSFGVILLEMDGFRHRISRGKGLDDYRGDIRAAAAVSACPVVRLAIADAAVRISSRDACGLLGSGLQEGALIGHDATLAIRTSLPPAVVAQFAGRLDGMVASAAMCVTGRIHRMTPKNASEAMRLSAAASGVLLRPRNGRK